MNELLLQLGADGGAGTAGREGERDERHRSAVVPAVPHHPPELTASPKSGFLKGLRQPPAALFVMRSRMSRLAAMVVVALLLGCGSGIPPGLTYYFSADPRSLDPALSTDVPTGESVTLIFDNLTQFDADGRIVPGIATSWWPSPDGRTWTFRIRKGVRFHDGRPLDVDAIAASFLRALNMGREGGRVWPLLPIDGAAAVVDSAAPTLRGLAVIDDSTIAFTLTEPLNIFPKLLAMPVAAIVPTPTPEDFGEQPVGSGPWKFVSWSHDDLLVLARNDHWWGGPPSPTRPDQDDSETSRRRRVRVGPPLGGRDSAGETQRWERNTERTARRAAMRPCTWRSYHRGPRAECG